MGVHDKERTMATVAMTIAEHGGRVKVVGKRDNKIAAMEIDEHGGRMDVYALRVTSSADHMRLWE